MRILLIEDEQHLGAAVQEHLRSESHAVDWAQTLADGDAAAAATDYELLLLDLNLPDGEGVSLLKSIRERGNDCPVLILTAQDQISDRIAGLNAGADDYLVKPFDLEELSARIQAVIRRYSGNLKPVTDIGDISIDLTAKLVWRSGEEITLTRREWAILDLLSWRPGAIVSKEKFEEALYEFGEEVESNAVEVHISRLRKKLGAEAIGTQRGVGYKLVI
ncbi:response regulator [Nisaea acidiphila]|uniref:Response regulator n=1 Tax=Nisaea acidiphila TaxID=1862145 RepID=A0A9J7ANE6_9PROT|nr:response regulator [Nisaea acidiphila]UUX48711.1 response regulator [Nisaea acidiphila]